MTVVFFDSWGFIECLENPGQKRILTAIYKDRRYQLVTSITVIGETTIKLRDRDNASNLIQSFFEILDEYSFQVIFPDYTISLLCYHMGLDDGDSEMLHQPTDKVHLAYAISHGCQYFISGDRALRDYALPESLVKKDFNKPEVLPLYDFRRKFLPHAG